MQANLQGTHQMHSLPAYREPSWVAKAAHHLIVLSNASLHMRERLLPGLRDVGSHAVTWIDPRDNCGDFGSLTRALQEALDRGPIGTHLYLVGGQSHIWALYNVACEAGMQPEEISLIRSDQGGRRAYCVHCAFLQDVEEGATATCAGCGIRLSVRDHFSRRLGAFMAVCENADHPYGIAAA